MSAADPASSPGSPAPASPPHAAWADADVLGAVERELCTWAGPDDEPAGRGAAAAGPGPVPAGLRAPGLLHDAVAPLLAAPAAKRARPRLLVAFASLAGAPHDHRLVDAACAVELIHSASLLHDDVIDGADERRGAPAANARFGNAAAVLAGDHVLARALRALAFDPRAMSAAVDVVLRMSAAAVCEQEVRGRIVDVRPADLEAVARGKTAGIFGLCGTLATLLAEPWADLRPQGAASASQRATPLADAGIALGLAFQEADDIADVAGDIRERTPTLPLARTAVADAAFAAALEEVWARGASSPPRDDEVEALAARVPRDRSGVRRHLEAALRALSPWAGAAAHEQIARFAAALAGPH